MKNQYYGDRRDFFKFDLLLDLTECQQHSRLLFIPMLTPNDDSGEGGVTKYECGARRQVLFDSLCSAVESGKRDIRALHNVLPRCGVDFLPYRDSEHFQHANRQAYFDAVPSDWLASSVVFFDPDIGLETGTTSYMRGSGSEKYLMYADLTRVAARATDDSVMVIYQHLQRNAGQRAGDIERRLRELATVLRTPNVYAVQWADLAFLVAVRDRKLGERVGQTVRRHAERHSGVFVEHNRTGSPGSPTRERKMPERCKHGMDGRFCSLCNAGPRAMRPRPNVESRPSSTATYELQDVVRFLNEEQVRATYGAIAELVGGIARGIGARLTTLYSMSAEASWVVSAESGLPTGYSASQRHPALLSKTDIISTGRELEQRMARRKRTRRRPDV